MVRNSLRLFVLLTGSAAAVAIAVACGSSDDNTGTTSSADSGANVASGPRGVEPAGQACTSPAQCNLEFPDGGADASDAGVQLTLKGAIQCLTKVPNGYCTHECTQDSDCCAVPGECKTAVKQVCAPLENTSSPKYCFLSCEDSDIQAGIAANADAGGWDGAVGDGGFDGGLENGYCYYYASIYATCRSTGGGRENRHVCIPQQ